MTNGDYKFGGGASWARSTTQRRQYARGAGGRIVAAGELILGGFGVDGIAEAIAEEVERQEGEAEEERGEEQQLGGDFHAVGAFLDEGTPGGIGSFHAEADEGEGGFREHDAGHSQGGVYHHGTQQIGGNVAEEDAQVPQPQRAGSHDVFLSLDFQGLCAHDTSEGEPAECADGNEKRHEPEDGRHAFAAPAGGLHQPGGHILDGSLDAEGEDDDQHDEGQGKEHIHRAHHESICAPADVAGDKPIHQPHDERHARGHSAHQQGDAATVEHAGQQITPELVCAEGMLPAAGAGNVVEVGGVGVGNEGEQWQQETGRRHKHEEHKRGHSRAVVAQAAHGVLPEGVTLCVCGSHCRRKDIMPCPGHANED